MVGLRDQREAALAQALDQPQLPERLRPVELLGEDPGGHPAQHVLVAGRRQGGVADVVAEVELRVVDPERPAGLDRRERRASAGTAGRGGGGSRRDRAGPRSSAAGPRRSSRRRCACGWSLDSLVRNEASIAVSRSMCPWDMALTYRACPSPATARPCRWPAPRRRCSRRSGSPSAGAGRRRAPRAPTGDSGDGFDGDRAFADVRAQVALGPRPSGSRAAVTLSRSLARELRARRRRRRPHPGAAPQRRRDDPGREERLRRPRRPLRHQARDPGLRRRQRRRLRRGRRPRARPGAAAADAGPRRRDRALRRRGGPPRARVLGRRDARQPPVPRSTPPRAAGQPAAERDQRRWSCSTWSATATSRSRARRTPTTACTRCFADADPTSSPGRPAGSRTTTPRSWRPGSPPST